MCCVAMADGGRLNPRKTFIFAFLTMFNGSGGGKNGADCLPLYQIMYNGVVCPLWMVLTNHKIEPIKRIYKPIEKRRKRKRL